jgi:hypothetical protein
MNWFCPVAKFLRPIARRGGNAMEVIFTVEDPDAFHQPRTGVLRYRQTGGRRSLHRTHPAARHHPRQYPIPLVAMSPRQDVINRSRYETRPDVSTAGVRFLPSW